MGASFQASTVFDAGGLLAEKFPGYAPRRGQVDMAELIQRAIAKGEHAIAEGPTGTGKSLAYLVPAIAHSTGATPVPPRGGRGPATTQPNGRTIVVTANIALQEQLVQKDLPMLAEILPAKFKFALAKGRNNYLCVDALGKVMADVLPKHDPQFERLLEWAKSTETGDSSEFPETPPPALWRKFSVGSDECKGSACRWLADCFAEKAKRAMNLANVVVTNYHLFFAHLVIREKLRAKQAAGAPIECDIVLPPADVVIFDEGHKAADIARDFLGFQVTKGSVDWLLGGFNHDVAEKAARASASFFADLSEHRRSKRYRSRLKRGHGLDEVSERFAESIEKVGKFYRDAIAGGAWDQDEKAELKTRARRAHAIAEQVREAASLENEGVVYFLDEQQNGAVSLKSKPIDVGPWLKNALFGQYKSVVVTSATLATGGGNPFSFVRKELGMEGGEELVAESPFAYGDKVMIVIPKTMEDPKNRDLFPGAVARHVREIAEASKGRMLGLFTSYKNLEASARTCEGLPYRVYRQGEGPRTLLTKRFREDVSSCLLGCESFWAGVDVPGESLSCVVIDRLPFPTPEDPIVDAISEKDDRWFFNYAVPRAVIQFKQGFGRLIRTVDDRGVVVVLDRRLTESSYGRQFIAALPRCRMADEVADVAAFLDRETTP